MRLVKTVLPVLVILAAAVPGLEAAKKLLGEGEGVFKAVDLGRFPEMTFTQKLPSAEREYLGLRKEGPFTLQDVDADLVFVEMLNVYCYACVQQAPFMNILHEKLEAREDLRERVRFLGVAVGNGEEEAAEFRGQFDIPYPVLADPEFELFDFVGNAGGTPFLILYPRGGKGAVAHLGLIRDADSMLAQIEAALRGAPPAGEGEVLLKGWRNLPPELSPSEIEERLRQSAAAVGASVEKVEKVEVTGEENVYRLSLAGGGGLWAKVAGRAKVCNICHDIFFILLFDDEGKVVNFTPITVTKYENVLISEEEAEFLRRRVVGRYVTEPVSFDPSVDAISTATMSSELIFDTVRRLKEAYGELTLKGAGK